MNKLSTPTWIKVCLSLCCPLLAHAQAVAPLASHVQPQSAAVQQVQTPSPSPSLAAMTAQPDLLDRSSDNILIGSGDLLDVSVFDAPELSRTGRVEGDGNINLPLLGNIHIAGMTEAEAAAAISDQLRDRRLLKAPQTSVLIREFAARGVTILGEVVRPGVYAIAGPRSLVDVLALAGGFTNLADTHVTIQRRNGVTEHVIESLPLDNAEKTFQNDTFINPGDRILAIRAGLVYVLGEVGRPGGYTMQYNGTLTLLQAMAWANGTTRLASERHVYLLRRDGASYTTREIALADIYKGKTPDLSLSANDVLYVPFSNLKNFVISGPQILGSIGSAAIYGANSNH